MTMIEEMDPRVAAFPIERAQARARRARPVGVRTMTPTVSVIVPTLNEARNLPHIFGELAAVDEVIVVDGRSTDDTVAVARALRKDVRIVLEKGKGKGRALKAGFEAATCDIIVMFDADGSADGHEIDAFVRALVHGADFAKGSRFLSGGGSADITPLRKLGNRILCAAVNIGFGSTYSDLCYGYNAFWRDCLPYLRVDSDGFEIETLINIRAVEADLIVREVPSFEHHRLYGESNLQVVRDGLRILRVILREKAARRRQSQHPAMGDLLELRAPSDLSSLGNAS